MAEIETSELQALRRNGNGQTKWLLAAVAAAILTAAGWGVAGVRETALDSAREITAMRERVRAAEIRGEESNRRWDEFRAEMIRRLDAIDRKLDRRERGQ